jgi:hypothetical protein
MGPEMGWAGRPGPISGHFVAYFVDVASRVFHNVLPSTCGPLTLVSPLFG